MKAEGGAIAQWRRNVHALAKEKGWYDRPRSWPEVRMLVVSELAEAAEEFRQGRLDLWWHGSKPEGFPIEIADAAIRLMDTAEAWEIYWDVEDEKIILDGNVDFRRSDRTLELLDQIVALLHDDGSFDDDACLWRGLCACFALARACRFDLLFAIALKHEYNKTRPYRHGGKAA